MSNTIHAKLLGTRFSTSTLSALGFLAVMAMAPQPAQAAGIDDIQRINPVRQDPGQATSPGFAATPANPLPAPDGPITGIASKLRQMQAQDGGTNTVLGQLSPRQRKAADALMQQAGTDLRLRVRQGQSTVRFLKPADPGKNLKQASPAAAGPDRDIETAMGFLKDNQALLNVADPAREFVLARRQRDRLGHARLRFEQRYQGLTVWPAEASVQLDSAGNVELFEGAYFYFVRFIPTLSRIVAHENPWLAAAIGVVWR
jgi:hypothetical protein